MDMNLFPLIKEVLPFSPVADGVIIAAVLVNERFVKFPATYNVLTTPVPAIASNELILCIRESSLVFCF